MSAKKQEVKDFQQVIYENATLILQKCDLNTKRVYKNVIKHEKKFTKM